MGAIKNPLFIDCEFTGLNQRNPGLLSLALVPVEGEPFYRELNDFDYGKCTSWVAQNVFPHLGMVQPISRQELKTELLQYLIHFHQARNGPVTICFDCYQDWQFVLDLVGQDKPQWLKSENILRFVQGENDLHSTHHALSDAIELRNKFIKTIGVAYQ